MVNIAVTVDVGYVVVLVFSGKASLNLKFSGYVSRHAPYGSISKFAVTVVADTWDDVKNAVPNKRRIANT